jgi:hypothetical protein
MPDYSYKSIVSLISYNNADFMFTWCDRFKSHIDNDGMLRQDIESLYILVLLDREKKNRRNKNIFN